MGMYSTGTLTGAGSTTLPIISLYSGAAVLGIIKEIGVTNTTATAVALKVVRLSTTGTQGAGLEEDQWRVDQVVSSCKAFTTHTANPTLGQSVGHRAQLGAVIGSGIVWEFKAGLFIPVGVANGIGVIVENGTGQICQAWIVWEE